MSKLPIPSKGDLERAVQEIDAKPEHILITLALLRDGADVHAIRSEIVALREEGVLPPSTSASVSALQKIKQDVTTKLKQAVDTPDMRTR